VFLSLLFVAFSFAKDVKTEIKVNAMTCGACSVSVHSALAKVKGVKCRRQARESTSDRCV
jgi:hypothetical protein